MNDLLDLKKLVDDFFLYTQSNNIEIYNEFSLQHEIGVFLREKLKGYRIQDFIILKDRYDFSWKPVYNKSRYYIIEI